MKRIKDEDTKDETMAVSSNAAVNKLNNSNNAAPNINNGNGNNNNNQNNSDANNANGGSAAGAAAGTVRTTGRVKKPKLVYDPSDNYISRGARTSLPSTLSSATVAAVPVGASATTATTATRPTSPAHQQQSQPAQSMPSATEIVSTASANNSSGNEESLDPQLAASAEQQLQLQRNFDTCSKCAKSELKRGSGYKSNFLACKTCALKWHFNCLPTAFEILTNARKRFKCDKCRRCRVCNNAKLVDKLPDTLIMCCVCANVYHQNCHWPRVADSKLSDSSWKCYSCDPTYNAHDTDTSTDTIDVTPLVTQPSTSTSPPLPPPPATRKTKVGRKKRATSDPAPTNAKKQAKDEEMELDQENDCHAEANSITLLDEAEHQQHVSNSEPPSPLPIAAATDTEASSLAPAIDLSAGPDDEPTDEQNGDDDEQIADEQEQKPVEELPQQPTVQSWNVEQVVSYVERFYPQESTIFKSQEIDGAALMVLTRQDIIDRFGLKLGPSLRIYQLVLSLQTSLDDVTLGWVE